MVSKQRRGAAAAGRGRGRAGAGAAAAAVAAISLAITAESLFIPLTNFVKGQHAFSSSSSSSSSSSCCWWRAPAPARSPASPLLGSRSFFSAGVARRAIAGGGGDEIGPMDCLCCTEFCQDRGAGPPSDSEFLGSICNLKDGKALFPAEVGRYTLYVVAGCPFAARPWLVLAFYGLAGGAIDVVKCFPASYEDGWFFEAQSEGEKSLERAFPSAQTDADPHHGSHHLSQLYEQAKKGFSGVVSVPLLWDSKQDTAVSNSSLGLAEMLATQMRCMGTRNQDVLLFPRRSDPEYEKHSELVKFLHTHVTTAVYKINGTVDGKEHDHLVDEYYETLDGLQERLSSSGQPFLMGENIRFADLVLFISLIRLDLAYQWRFRLGRKSVREDYPVLWQYVQRIFSLEGVSSTVLPRDIMALYFMTPKWIRTAGLTLPQVPEQWAKVISSS